MRTLPIAIWIEALLHIAVASAHPSAVRILNDPPGGTAYWSSGVYIGDNLFLTCAHCIDNGGTVTVLTQDHRRIPSQSFVTDKRFDIGIIRVASDPSIPPATLATSDPGVGATVTAYGFGGNGRLRAYSGRVLGVAAPRGVVWDWRRFSSPSNEGDSGGGVFDSRGRLIGTLHHSDMRTSTVYTSSKRTLQTLEAYRQQHPQQLAAAPDT